MNEQGKYFMISAGVHGILLTLLLILTANAVNHKEVVTIDFLIDYSPPSREPQQAMQSRPAVPAVPVRHPAQPEPVRQAVAQKAVPVPSVASTPIPAEPSPQPAAATAQQTQTAPGQTSESKIAEGKPVSAFNGEKSISSASSSNTVVEASVDQVKKRYLKEHFNYIRNLIVKRLSYPPIARKMEWSGKVVLAFVVNEDGGVSSIRIKESSGHTLLDNSAADTVRSVAPFPRPPVAAEIVMPVQFRLE